MAYSSIISRTVIVEGAPT